MRQLQFKFDPLPTESAKICLLHQMWIKTFYTQPFCKLCIKHGLVFHKIYLVHFCNNYLVVPSQKNLLLGTRKIKMNFPCKENENFLRRHCLEFKDVPLCTIWDHLNKLCHECGHKIDHFGLKAIDLHTWFSFLRTLF